MEKMPEQQQENEMEKTRERGHSPEKIMRGLGVFAEVPFSKFEVSGLENLKDIPPGKSIVLAATHMTDFDMPLAYYALGKELNIRFTNTKRLMEITGGDPISYMAIKIAGEENFRPIDYNKVKEGGKYKGKFNPDNFEPMQKDLADGEVDAVLIAAHNPSTNGKMTPHGGYGDVYLAQIADAVIVPVAVNIKSKSAIPTDATGKILSVLERPEVHVTVGKPLTLEKIQSIGRFKELLEKNENGVLTKGEIQEFSSTKELLQEQSGHVMEILAGMVPEEKRGTWESPEEQEARRKIAA